MDRFATVILRFPRTFLMGWIVLTLVVAAGTLRLTSKNNYEGDLPLSDPLVADQARFEAAFGDEQAMLVAVESPELLSDEALVRINDLSSHLSQMTGVAPGGVTGIATLVANPLDPNSSTVIDVLLTEPSVERRFSVLEGLPHVARFLSADYTTTLIAVDVSRSASQSDVAREVQVIRDRFSGPEQIYVIGDHTVAQAIDAGIESDLGFLLPLACALIVLAMRLCFGKMREALLAFCVMLGSVLWTLGLMGYLDVPLNVVTSTLPILLVVISSSYGIHVIRHYTHLDGSRERRVFLMLSKLGRPVLLTGLTSAAGTLSLLIFEVNSVREFGLFASLGIAAATVGALVFLPAALACLPLAKVGPGLRGVDQFLNKIGLVACRYRHVALLGCAVVILVSMVGITRIQIGMDPVSMFPVDHDVRKSTDVLTTRFSGCRYFDVMVDFETSGRAFEAEAISVVRDFDLAAANIENVTAVYSSADVVIDGIPLEAFHPTLIGSGMIDEVGRHARIRVMTAATDQADQERLHGQLQEIAGQHIPGVYAVSFGGPVLRWIAQNRYVSIGKVLSVIAASLCVLMFCTVAFRSLRAGFVSTIPLLISTVATFGVMGWAGIRLNMATAITTSIGLGIGIDFGIHFISRLRSELAGASIEDAVTNTMATTGRAILYDVGSNVLGFGVLVFSMFGPVRDFGWLISLTMFTCAAGTLIILPAVAPWLKRRSPASVIAHTTTPLEAV